MPLSRLESTQLTPSAPAIAVDSSAKSGRPQLRELGCAAVAAFEQCHIYVCMILAYDLRGLLHPGSLEQQHLQGYSEYSV